jgi:hypothetical protein
MGMREQVLQDDLRREFRAADLELLASILRADGQAGDAGGRLVPFEGKPLDMATGSAGLPEGGEEYQVVQRDGDGEAVWDWVRYVVPSEE